MNKKFRFIFVFYLMINIFNTSISNENFFIEGLDFYKNKKYDDARFMFERSIVFNPKDSQSYLYLAKIYNHEEKQDKEEKNLKTALLIEPNNEEALLMMMKIALKKSNYSQVNDLLKNFKKVCEKLCNENKEVIETLANIDPKNES